MSEQKFDNYSTVLFSFVLLSLVAIFVLNIISREVIEILTMNLLAVLANAALVVKSHWQSRTAEA